MALLADESADAGSHLTATGLGTRTAVFTMPNAVAIKVQSVVATIDNTTGADATGKVTLSDKAGQVIATSEQFDAVPAGDTGTQTFALNLGAKGVGIRFGRVNTGNWLNVVTTTALGTLGGGAAFIVQKGEFFVQAKGSVNSAFHVDADFVEFDCNNHNYIVNAGNLMQLNVDSFDAIGTTQFSLSGAASAIVGNSTNGVTVTLPNGKPMTVKDHLGNSIFRVDENGDLHGKTGKALVFDL